MIRDFLKCSFLLVVAACSITPEIPLQPLPAPAMEKLPVHVALITDDAFRNFKFDSPLKSPLDIHTTEGGGTLHYELGEMNVDLFSQVSSSLFAQVTRFDSWEALKASGGLFDGVLVPAVAHFDAGSTIGSIYPSIFANVTYEFLFFDQYEIAILDWNVVSQQLICQDVAWCHDGYNNIMSLVERDVAAKILSGFPEFPEITDWVKSIESGW